jgi:hypothetical protein
MGVLPADLCVFLGAPSCSTGCPGFWRSAVPERAAVKETS